MFPLRFDTIARSAATTLLIALAATGTESAAIARPWEPIETAFDYDDAVFRKGVLVLPNFGLVAPEGSDKSIQAKPGFRMGGMLGWHLSPRLSMNGEINLSVLRFEADTANGDDEVGFLFDYALSPLYHIGARNLEVILGPKLGRFRYSLPDARYGDAPLSRSTGWSYGLNFGILAPLQSMAIGGLVSFTSNHATEICDVTCHTRTSSAGDLRVLTTSFAMLY
jgi:hypothetical protein